VASLQTALDFHWFLNPGRPGHHRRTGRGPGAKPLVVATPAGSHVGEVARGVPEPGTVAVAPWGAGGVPTG
jgi:hypothetical protein